MAINKGLINYFDLVFLQKCTYNMPTATKIIMLKDESFNGCACKFIHMKLSY